jgi:hypothetical protein
MAFQRGTTQTGTDEHSSTSRGGRCSAGSRPGSVNSSMTAGGVGSSWRDLDACQRRCLDRRLEGPRWLSPDRAASAAAQTEGAGASHQASSRLSGLDAMNQRGQRAT